jgi:hypothetical protein
MSLSSSSDAVADQIAMALACAMEEKTAMLAAKVTFPKHYAQT